TPSQNELLVAEIRHQIGYGKEKLPRGAVHGDLFRDNVLFDGTRVAGIIDFGFAATDYFAYDLAVAVNDWCSDADGGLRSADVAAFVGAYERVRALSTAEREQWPSLMRAAALRFWLSRLYDLHLPRGGVLTHAHDPAEYERVLRSRVASPPRLPPVATGVRG
ncbi:MAG TPA: phosphotransferase, partial [Casimicrobiaceae bacterium]